jgi:hypothetical protein
VVLVRELGLLAIYLHRGDRAKASRVLESVTEQLRKLGVYEDARPTLDELSRCIREGLWDDAFANYQVLVDVVARVDPATPQRVGDGVARFKDRLYAVFHAVEEKDWERLERSPEVFRELRELAERLPYTVGLATLRETVDALEKVCRARDYERALWIITSILFAIDPVISASVSRETYEAYERAARPEQTVSEYAREVLEGRRVPAVASDGVRAGATVAEYLRSIGQEAEHERVIREYLSAIGARRVEGVVPQPTPQPAADWESILAQYRREIEAYMRGERPPGNPSEQPNPQSGNPTSGNPDKGGALDRVLREVLRELPEVAPCRSS